MYSPNGPKTSRVGLGVFISLGYGLCTMDSAWQIDRQEREERGVSQFGHYLMQSLSHSRLLAHTYATALIPFRNPPSIIRTVSPTNARIHGSKLRRMEKRDENQKSVAVESTTRLNNPRVDKLQQLVHKDSTGNNQKQNFLFFFWVFKMVLSNGYADFV